MDFKDDCFSVKKDRIKKICRMLIDKHIRILWGCETRIDMVDEELFTLMARAGCHNIRFGMESAVDRVRKIIGKNPQMDQLDKILRILRKLKIISVGFFLVGHPTETISEIKETLKFAVGSQFDIVEINLVTPVPGSKLFDIAVSEKVIQENIWEKVITGSSVPTYVPKNLRFEDIEKLKRKAMLQFYLKPRTIIRFMRNIRSVSDLSIQFQTAWELLKWNLLRLRK